MEKPKQRIRIELTAEQKKQIKEASGEDVQAIELTAQELEDRLGEVVPHFSACNVERGDAFDVADMVAAEIEMHQTGDRDLAGGAAVKLDPLDQRGGAIPDANDRHPDFRHRNAS